MGVPGIGTEVGNQMSKREDSDMSFESLCLKKPGIRAEWGWFGLRHVPSMEILLKQVDMIKTMRPGERAG